MNLRPSTMKCANSTHDNTDGAVPTCDYFAYDAADKDCYVFNGCAAEGFDDDYKLFTLPYPTKLALVKSLGEVPGCTNTRATGGCATSRCDKNSNTYNKVRPGRLARGRVRRRV